MSELVVLPPPEFTDGLRDYGRTVLSYAWLNDFPQNLLKFPDHAMVKSPTPTDFDQKVKAISPWAERLTFTQIDSRFLVAAELIVPMALSDLSGVPWVEIMESKSPEGTADYLGVEYAEFYHDNFNQAGLALKKKRIAFEKRTDDWHRWLSIKLNDKGQELRITDRPLAVTIGNELDEGTAIPLPKAA